MAERYVIFNGPAPTTASQVAVTTGTAIKTLLQAKLGISVGRGFVFEWGISFDGAASAAPIITELLTTGTVAATVTAHAASGIQNVDPKADTPTSGNPFTLSTSTTGYTASAEGTITTTRMLACHQLIPNGPFVERFPLGFEKEFSNLEYLRIRVKAATACNAICWVGIDV